MPPILINPKQLKRLIQDPSVMVVDTRTAEEFEKGHIPKAVNIPSIFTYLSDAENGGLAALVDTFCHELGNAGITADHQVVIYEDTLNGGYGQSCRGYFILQYLGHAKVSILHGGYQEWLNGGFPVTQERTLPNATCYYPHINAAIVVTKEQMKDALSNEAIIKLDCRDEEEWQGLSSSPYGVDFAPRKGRIPEAVWLAWTKLIEEDEAHTPRFADNKKILALCQEAGIYPDSTVYVYCFKGSRSANTMLALKKAGITQVRNYFGSWNEWSRDLSLPIDDRILK